MIVINFVAAENSSIKLIELIVHAVNVDNTHKMIRTRDFMRKKIMKNLNNNNKIINSTNNSKI